MLVSASRARARRSLRARAFCFALLLSAAGTSAARAVELALPADAVARIDAACPDCDPKAWTACGGQNVAWGKGFATRAFLGTPKRGYLLSPSVTGDEFRNAARGTGYPTLVPGMRRRFHRLRLVVLDEAFAGVRVLTPPSDIQIEFPKALHDCVYAGFTPWGCCVGKCKEAECCEKKLGSPKVEVTWKDGDETLVLHYSHTVGASWLERRIGTTNVRYACLVDAKGKLRASDAK